MELNSYQLTKDKVVGEEADSRQKIDIQLYTDVMKGMQNKKMICEKGDCLPGFPSIVIEPKPRDTCVERANGEIACGTEISPDKTRPGKAKPDWFNPDSVKPDFVKPESIEPESIKPESIKPESGKPDFVKPVPEKPGIGDEWEGDSKGKPKNPPKNPTKNPEECRDVGYLLSNPPIAVCLDNLSGGTEKDRIGTQKDRTKTLPSGKGFTKLPGLVLE